MHRITASSSGLLPAFRRPWGATEALSLRPSSPTRHMVKEVWPNVGAETFEDRSLDAPVAEAIDRPLGTSLKLVTRCR